MNEAEYVGLEGLGLVCFDRLALRDAMPLEHAMQGGAGDRGVNELMDDGKKVVQGQIEALPQDEDEGFLLGAESGLQAMGGVGAVLDRIPVLPAGKWSRPRRPGARPGLSWAGRCSGVFGVVVAFLCSLTCIASVPGECPAPAVNHASGK